MPVARRTEAAQCDLQSIAFQLALADGSHAAADRIIDELIEQSEKLASYSPGAIMGTAAPEVGADVRLFSYKRWVVVFRYAPHGVDILRFADGAQDYLSWKLS